MRLRARLGVAVALPYAIQASQAPFQLSSPRTASWEDLNVRPDVNATGNFIFEEVNSLLQHWPNTRYRNGHSIVPGTIPTGTLLYHGRANNSMSSTPEWTSTDPEHSYNFCGHEMATADNSSGCWHLTVVATRPLKVLYFDGSSAAKMKDGTMDVQDLLVWGDVDPARWAAERERINKMCAWGKDFGIDGYLRMEMDFEVMLCDFHNGVELVSADFLQSWVPRHVEPPLWNAYPEYPEFSNVTDILRFEMVRAGAWHNHHPGETRAVLDLTRLVSFYDPALTPSLLAHRAGKPRWDHRQQNISAADLAAVQERLKSVLDPGNTEMGSGVDWRTLFRVVVDRYADRLELLQYLLKSTTADNAAERTKTMQRQLRVMLTPYILFSVRPSAAADNDAWAGPVWRGCATRHTEYIHTSLTARLTQSERLLLGALDETNREVCRSIVRMWVAGVRAGFDEFLPIPPKEAFQVGHEKLSLVLDGWREETQALMAWLDWSVWVKCRPACGVEEICYLPTWPYFWRSWDDVDNEEGQWKRPQPRCIRQFEPYSPL
ncbi:hypothetical protein DFH06DRAFT_980293 [Mycena polygramma]|nr:hypothetical protein DFH06DRAFT_980293 [Mycena polygramma]